TGAQQNIADHMAAQVRGASSVEKPSFLYHLGDVVYYHGDDDDYHDQFYFPYQKYPAPIFAIPGNHDGDTTNAADTLRPFYKHFCAPARAHAPGGGHSNRPTMTLPICYWRLDAPLVSIGGLSPNVWGERDDPNHEPPPQTDWLTDQLRPAPA